MCLAWFLSHLILKLSLKCRHCCYSPTQMRKLRPKRVKWLAHSVAALGCKLRPIWPSGPVVHPAICFSLPDTGTFLVMKEPDIYLTNHLAGTYWHPRGSRARNGQGPEGFEGFHRQDFKDNWGTFQHPGNIPAGFFTASLPPFTQRGKSLKFAYWGSNSTWLSVLNHKNLAYTVRKRKSESGG